MVTLADVASAAGVSTATVSLVLSGKAEGRVAKSALERAREQIATALGAEGQDHMVYVEQELARPFGNLVRFRVARREPMERRVLLIAPMSGHYATLLRSTVTSLLPHTPTQP